MAVLVISGLLVACLYHGMASLAGYPAPWSSFLLSPSIRFSDWGDAVASAATHNPYRVLLRAVPAYFPAAYIVLLVGNMASTTLSIAAYVSISLALLVSGVTVMWRRGSASAMAGGAKWRMEAALLCVTFLFSYPVLFSLDRGNIDVWIACLCMLFTASLRTPQALVGAVVLALAISLKGYPLAFLLLAAREKRYGLICVTLLLAVIFTVGALAAMPGTLADNAHAWAGALNQYYEVYVIGNGSLRASSDPYNLLRVAVLVMSKQTWLIEGRFGVAHDMVAFSLPLLKAYGCVSLIFAAACAGFVVFAPASAWQPVMAVCLVAILFPNVAADYKLTMLLPGAMALLSHYDQSRVRDQGAFVCVAALLVPKNYLFIHGIGLGVVLSPLILITLACFVLADRSGWSGVVTAMRQGVKAGCWYCHARIKRAVVTT